MGLPKTLLTLCGIGYILFNRYEKFEGDKRLLEDFSTRLESVYEKGRVDGELEPRTIAEFQREHLHLERPKEVTSYSMTSSQTYFSSNGVLYVGRQDVLDFLGKTDKLK